MEEFVNIPLTFAENTVLETNRLRLRPLKITDAKDMYEYASDEETTRYVFQTHRSLEDSKFAIANYFMADPLGKYAIEEKKSGKMIGTIDLRVEANYGRGELGYTLNKAYWGQGLMPEAAFALLVLGFDKMKLVAISAYHNLENAKSGRVMEKIGMKKVAEIKSSRLWKGELIDEALYLITAADWQKRVM
ncbi:GNAT family N-acetyltransferase [Enterococcus sp. MJM12]|uniref:GNAT family N-acetyltransferase n=1 Tax=Candidatus Enterococcus myersii TaxID=2815322 RepID=A0ABS3H772_9ENTE|nr:MULTISPECIES: GNAT family N-acetyltransferase [unclassified Enterococcus]MBO0449307.1 GNAT family N-acetyltransferase [Enterococcus sp. MJM12]